MVDRALNWLTGLVALAAVAVATKQLAAPQGSSQLPGRPDTRQIEADLIGETLDSLDLTLRGQASSQTVSFGTGVRQLVFLFQPDCPACQQAEPAWRALASGVGATIPVSAITGEGPRTEFELFSNSRIRVWNASSPRALARAFRSPLVPVTILVSGQGVVEYARVGVPSSSDVDSLKSLLAQ